VNICKAQSPFVFYQNDSSARPKISSSSGYEDGQSFARCVIGIALTVLVVGGAVRVGIVVRSVVVAIVVGVLVGSGSTVVSSAVMVALRVV
jgi:hypothetical protein